MVCRRVLLDSWMGAAHRQNSLHIIMVSFPSPWTGPAVSSWFRRVVPVGLSVFLLLAAVVRGQEVRINEVMASNGDTVADEDGDYEDWIELHNAGHLPLDLEGWGLSDDYDDPFRWTFPAVVLGPGEFLLVWASGKDRTNSGAPLHTNYSISASGEEVLLTRPDGERVDELPPTRIPGDISIGRLPGEGTAWFFFDEPTPGAANTTPGYTEILDPPGFSHEGGFYSSSFQLSLDAPPGTTILYTLDGTEPELESVGGTTYQYKNSYPSGSLLERTLETHIYESPISVQNRSGYSNPISGINTRFTSSPHSPPGSVFSGTPVRARAVREGALSSRAVTHTYFVHPNAASLYDDILVLSIVTDERNLFDYYTGIFVEGVWGDAWPGSSGDGWKTANYQGRGIDWERPGHLEVFEPQEGRALAQGIGIRTHGGWSRMFSPRKSIRLYARGLYDEANTFEHPFFPGLTRRGEGGGPLESFRRLMVRNSGNDWNGTLIQDAVQHYLVRDLPLDNMGYTRSVVHFINGEFWGIMQLRERMDQHYIASHYGMDPEEIVMIDVRPVVDPGYLAMTDGPFYAGLPMPNIMIKRGTMDDRDAYLALHNFAVQADLSDPANFAVMEAHVDLENLATYYAINVYAGNHDWPQNNVDIWRKRTDQFEPDAPFGHDGRWRWMLFDLDFGFEGSVSRNSLSRVVNNSNVSPFGTPPSWSTDLFRNMLANEGFRNLFINRLADLATIFAPERVERAVDEFNARISGYRGEHWARWGSGTNQGQFIKDFGRERGAHVRNHVLGVFGLPGTANLTVENALPEGGRIRVNSLEIGPDTPRVEPLPVATVVAVERESDWRFLDDGSDPGISWSEPQFDDLAWPVGSAPFGYGESVEFATEIGTGFGPDEKPITTYFRRTFDWESSEAPDSMDLLTTFDGGAVFYLNGNEIKRQRMPEGSIDSSTPAEGPLAAAALDGLTAWYDAGAEMETRLRRAERFVTSWSDLSGNGRHAAQDSQSAQPLLIEDGVNGKPVVRFDGDLQFLQAPIPDTRAGMTLFAVARVYAEGDSFGSYFGLSGAGAANVRYHVGSGGGSGLGIAHPGQNLAESAQASERFEVIRIEAHGDYTHTVTRLSSGQSVSARLTQTGGVVDTLLLGAAGGLDDTPTGRLSMELAELLLFDREVTGEASFQVVEYLSAKYEIPVAPIFSVGLEDMSLWLTADGPMSTRSPFFSSNIFVTSWHDRSGNGRNAVQSQNSRQPLLVQDAINGLPALRFDGNDDFLQAPIEDHRDAMTFYMVARLHGSTGAFSSYAGFNGAGTGNVVYHTGTLDGRGQGLGIGIGQPDVNLVQDIRVSTEYDLFRIEAGPGALHRITRVNGGSSVAAVLLDSSGLIDNLTIAASRGADESIGDFAALELAEVLIFERQLEGRERHEVERYLSLKYGFEPPVWYQYSIDPEQLKPGENVLAAEIHQKSSSWDDFGFDAELRATHSESSVRWRGIYFLGVPVEIEAIAEPGYRFVGWAGIDSTEPVLSLDLTSSGVIITPEFEFDEGSLEEAVPPPHPLASGAYHFTGWDPDSPAGTYPEHMVFEQTLQGDPALGVEMDGFWVLPYNLESRSRINGLGESGFAFINTANAQDHPDAGYLGSAILALDTRGVDNIQVTWTAGTVLPNDRIYGLRAQFRVGDQGPFADLQDEDGGPVEYLRNASAGHSEIIGPLTLPSHLEDLPYVQIRWKYHHISGDSGPRAQLRIGDILVTSGTAGEAVSLEFTQVFDAPRQSGGPFPTVLVRALDENGLPAASFSGEITLATAGAAEIAGQTTVAATNGVAEFDGLTLSGAGLISLEATAQGLAPATSETFRLVALTEVIMPLWIQGEQDAAGDNLNRVPFAFRLALEGLRENAVYRFGNRIVEAEDPPEQNGAGNTVWVTGPDSDWIRNTDSPRFRASDAGGRHHTFTSDAGGRYEGWFVTEPSGNARFTPGNTVWVRLLLNDGDDGEETFHTLTAEAPVTVIGWGDAAGEATAVIGSAASAPRSFVLLFDEETGGGRPLSATPVESTGAEVDSRYAPFYHESVAPTEGGWGTLIPNGMSTGVRRIEERSLTDGSLLAVRRFPEGIPSTVQADFGLEPLVLEGIGGDTYAGWLEVRYPDPIDRADPALTSMEADPENLGIPNLLRYALSIPAEGQPHEFLPRVEVFDGRLSLVFRRFPDKDDIAYLVQASDDLTDWSEILFDSRQHEGEPINGKEIRVRDSMDLGEAGSRRFLRLKVLQLP
jgi:hypothetical protein